MNKSFGFYFMGKQQGQLQEHTFNSGHHHFEVLVQLTPEGLRKSSRILFRKGGVVVGNVGGRAEGRGKGSRSLSGRRERGQCAHAGRGGARPLLEVMYGACDP